MFAINIKLIIEWAPCTYFCAKITFFLYMQRSMIAKVDLASTWVFVRTKLMTLAALVLMGILAPYVPQVNIIAGNIR